MKRACIEPAIRRSEEERMRQEIGMRLLHDQEINDTTTDDDFEQPVSDVEAALILVGEP